MQTKIDGVERLAAKLKDLETMQRELMPVMAEAGKLVEKLGRDQPPKKQGAFSQFATPGQRRAYWAKVGRGEAQHSESSGYVRSGKSAKAWESNVYHLTNGVRVEIVNDVGYAPWLHGNQNRQRFHAASGFLKEFEMVNRVSEPVLKLTQQAVWRKLNK